MIANQSEAAPMHVQLEIAAHWLREASFVLTRAGDKETSAQLDRVAHNCMLAIKNIERPETERSL